MPRLTKQGGLCCEGLGPIRHSVIHNDPQCTDMNSTDTYKNRCNNAVLEEAPRRFRFRSTANDIVSAGIIAVAEEVAVFSGSLSLQASLEEPRAAARLLELFECSELRVAGEDLSRRFCTRLSAVAPGLRAVGRLRLVHVVDEEADITSRRAVEGLREGSNPQHGLRRLQDCLPNLSSGFSAWEGEELEIPPHFAGYIRASAVFHLEPYIWLHVIGTIKSPRKPMKPIRLRRESTFCWTPRPLGHGRVARSIFLSVAEGNLRSDPMWHYRSKLVWLACSRSLAVLVAGRHKLTLTCADMSAQRNKTPMSQPFMPGSTRGSRNTTP